MIGTLFFTMFFVTHNSIVMLLGLWIITIFFWKLSGSMFNPAVTLALMFRRDDKKMPLALGIGFIVAQFLGGLLGGLLANFMTFDLPPLLWE